MHAFRLFSAFFKIWSAIVSDSQSLPSVLHVFSFLFLFLFIFKTFSNQ